MNGAAHAIEPDLSRWDAWRPEQVASLLADVDVPWYVAAGWAIDLFLGGQRREHEDIEIAVPNDRFGEVAKALSGFEIFVITGPGEATPLARVGTTLETHQTWVRDPGTGSWRLDVFREPSEGETWICRREPRIRLPFDQVIDRTADGVPYGRPEIVLLYKAKHVHQEKDRDDFAAVLPVLEPEQRTWLAGALRVVHPGHEWIAALERAGG
ncbi:MAG: nucleotidyltransferase domain-containing protein [Gaiellaceae bacterium]